MPATLLDSGFYPFPTNQTFYTTGVVAPGVDKLILLSFLGYTPQVINPATVTGLGLTWDLVADGDFDLSGGFPSRYLLAVFRAQGTPIPGVITVTCGGQTWQTFAWTVTEHDSLVGNNGADAILQAKQDGNVDSLAFDSPPAPTNDVWSVRGTQSGNITPTPPLTLVFGENTNLGGAGFGTAEGLGVDPCEWGSTSFRQMINLEIAPAVVPPAPVVSAGGGGMSGLGCGENQAFIADRNGRLLVELPFSELSYARRLDDLSEASVSLGVGGRTGEVCCDVLSRLRPWEHLLIVYRDTGEVWVGIVAEPHYTPTEVKLSARDLFQVFERRVLPFDRDFLNVDLSDIFRQYALDALSRDNSYGITVAATDSGKVGSRSVRTVEYRRAADELRELAKIGVDFTMRGRQLIATGEQTVPSFKLITTDFVNQEIGIGGLQTATEVIVRGAQRDDGFRPVGIAGGVDPVLGLVQLVIDEDSITDEASAQSAAEAYLALLSEPPTVVSGILDARASVEFSDLVPGRVCDLRIEAGCRRVLAHMRLSEVSVSVSVGDEGTTESVGVTFVPVTLGEGG